MRCLVELPRIGMLCAACHVEVPRKVGMQWAASHLDIPPERLLGAASHAKADGKKRML
jgi:hypothetical protein